MTVRGANGSSSGGGGIDGRTGQEQKQKQMQEREQQEGVVGCGAHFVIWLRINKQVSSNVVAV
jgi:hypothetical protein